MNVNEEKVLQIIRVEEPVTLHALCRWLPEAKLGAVDKTLWEMTRQGRVHPERINEKEVWLYGAKSH
jgi:hypothetical protein